MKPSVLPGFAQHRYRTFGAPCGGAGGGTERDRINRTLAFPVSRRSASVVLVIATGLQFATGLDSSVMEGGHDRYPAR